MRRQNHTNRDQFEAPRRSLALERLEQRLLLAGNVTAMVSGGDLVITGDEADNVISIDQDGLGVGEFRVNALDGTTVNGVAGPQVFTGVTGDLEMEMEEGDDWVELDNVSVDGDVKFEGGDGDNDLEVMADIAGDLEVDNDDGFDTVELDASVVGGDVDIDNNDGGSDVYIEDSYVGGDLMIENDDGMDFVGVDQSQISGDVDIDNDDGGSMTYITGRYGNGYAQMEAESTETSRIGGDLKIENEDGADFLMIAGTDIGEDVEIDNGDGGGIDNGYPMQVEQGYFGGSWTALASVTVGADLSVENEDGYDEFIMLDSVITGDMSIENGDGGSETALGEEFDYMPEEPFSAMDVFEEFEGNNLIGGELEVENGDGADRFSMYGTTVGDDVSIDNGSGAESMHLAEAGVQAGPGRFGSQTFIIESLIDGDLEVENEDGFDEFVLIESQVSHDVSIENGDGGSDTSIGIAFFYETRGVQLAPSEPFDEVEGNTLIGGKLEVENGTGTDSFFMLGTAVGDDVSIDNGDGGEIMGRPEPDYQSQDGGFGSETLIIESLISGELEVQNGSGFDALVVADSIIGDDAKIDNEDGGSDTELEEAEFLEDLEVKNEDGTDYLGMEGSLVGGDMNVENGHGNTETEIGWSILSGEFELESEDGFDGLYLYDMQILGDTEIDHNDGGSETGVEDVTFANELEINSGLESDFVGMVWTTVYGDAEIQTRGGMDTVDISDSEFLAKLEVETGSEQDEVLLDVEVLGRTIVRGDLSVDLGDDDDELQVGDADDGMLETSSDVLFDGNDGTDLIDYLGHGNDFRFEPEIINFEDS